MKIRKLHATIVFGLISMLPALARAGAGANMNACIYLPVPPSAPLNVNFIAGGAADHCMNNTGNNANITVSTAGVSCIGVGYVEGKSSSTGGDACATDTSIWVLSYSVAGTAYSGSTQSTWSHPVFGSNHIKLQDSSPGTVVCSNQNRCTSTSLQWDSGTKGPLYIIFQPQSSSSSATKLAADAQAQAVVPNRGGGLEFSSAIEQLSWLPWGEFNEMPLESLGKDTAERTCTWEAVSRPLGVNEPMFLLF